MGIAILCPLLNMSLLFGVEQDRGAIIAVLTPPLSSIVPLKQSQTPQKPAGRGVVGRLSKDRQMREKSEEGEKETENTWWKNGTKTGHHCNPV